MIRACRMAVAAAAVGRLRRQILHSIHSNRVPEVGAPAERR